MTRITQNFGDSGQQLIACKIRVTLNDLLVNYAADPDIALLPQPRVFDIPSGAMDIEIRESATQRVTYNFFVFVPETVSTYYLDGVRFYGDTHKDSENQKTYTGIAPSANRRELNVIESVTEKKLYEFTAIVPDVQEVALTDLLGQAVVSSRYVDRNFYSSILLGLPGTDGVLDSLPNLTVLQASIQTLTARTLALETELGDGTDAEIDQGALDRITALEALSNSNDFDIGPLLTRLAALEDQVYNSGGGGGSQNPDTTPPTASPSPIQP